MNKHFGLKCSLCDAEYSVDEIHYTCPKDGGNLDVIIDYYHIRKHLNSRSFIQENELSFWRYFPLLPVHKLIGEGTPLRAAGYTPVFSPHKLKNRLNLRFLWVKDESRNPTASFKDRASAIVVARAQELKKEAVVTASTGNAGAALAGMAAAVNQKAIIFAPKTAPPAKVAQLLIYGSEVLLVDGSYDDAFDLTIEAAEEFGWYCRNTGYNPFTAEGKKTAAYEIWEWFNSRNFDINLPIERLSIIVSVGDGNIISGIHKGFKDLLALGWIDTIPRIIGVQAEGSAAIANAFFDKTEELSPVIADTIADSIAVDLPRDGIRAVRAAVQTGGFYLTVSDSEILAAISDLGEVGIFAEPAGAASYAGLVKAVNDEKIAGDDPVLIINTGSGLKDIGPVREAVAPATIIEPTLDAVKALIY